jgi:patatin-like phospholipase/acyl hydrolase
MFESQEKFSYWVDGGMERFQILSLDGGGIKGLFSAAILAFFEEDLGVRISDHFDLVVGTSTGGIIALALGMGMSPREIVRFYVDKGPAIFPKVKFPRIKHFLKRKYDSANLEKVLIECFGDKRLADSKKRLVIPSYNISTDDVYLFKTPHHEKLRRDYKVPVWKVAMATSAAPTYFSSFQKVDHIRLIDGGVWTNNPTMVGIIEAISMLNISPNVIQVLSLGTTNEVKEYPKKLDHGGILSWKNEAVKVILQGQNIGAITQAQHLLGKEKILRINPSVPDKLFALDKISENALLAKAAHESRHFAPEFKDKFSHHIAQDFKPFHY